MTEERETEVVSGIVDSVIVKSESKRQIVVNKTTGKDWDK